MKPKNDLQILIDGIVDEIFEVCEFYLPCFARKLKSDLAISYYSVVLLNLACYYYYYYYYFF